MNIKTQTSLEMTEELNKTPGGSRPRQQLTGGSTVSGGWDPPRTRNWHFRFSAPGYRNPSTVGEQRCHTCWRIKAKRCNVRDVRAAWCGRLHA